MKADSNHEGIMTVKSGPGLLSPVQMLTFRLLPPTQMPSTTHLLLPVVRQWQVMVSTLGLLVIIQEGV